MDPQVNVMTWPILLESREGSRRYRIITVPLATLGLYGASRLLGYMGCAVFKAPFIHGFLAKNEWVDIVKGLL